MPDKTGYTGGTPLIACKINGNIFIFSHHVYKMMNRDTEDFGLQNTDTDGQTFFSSFIQSNVDIDK